MPKPIHQAIEEIDALLDTFAKKARECDEQGMREAAAYFRGIVEGLHMAARQIEDP